MNANAIRRSSQVTATAPGGIGNLGPGLDVLGCALTGPGDVVRAWREGTGGVRIAASGHPELPDDPWLHASALAAQAILDAAAASGQETFGVAIELTKHLPLAGGQGGSAASAVAGAAAANALLDHPLGTDALIAAALHSESILAGRHLDNIAPCVLGGVVLVRSTEPVDIVRLPAPTGLRIVLAHPEMRLRTRDARAVLPREIDRATALHQGAQMAAIVAACLTDDLALLGRAIDDRIAEPARAALLPGFTEAKRAALDAGALGCSISGAGPTSFAFTTEDRAHSVADAMRAGYERGGVCCTTRVAQVSDRGVQVASQ